MNVKKAIKRIAALAAGTTMVTATIMGAMAYDLGDYPEPFVKNGLFNGKIVVGNAAEVSDVIGAIDIAASLQAAAKTPVDAAGSTATVSVTGGVQIMSSSEDFNFADSVNDFNSGNYDSDDFPDLLADGTVEDDDGSEYDYELTIDVPASQLLYDQHDDYGDDPVFYLDLATGSPILTFNVEFSDRLDVTELDDSESIEMFGKVYTFDPNHAVGDDLTLYGSDVTVAVTQNEPVTIKSEGDDYTIEILGGNTGDSSAIIRVTGDGDTETKTLQSGDSRNMAGLDLFVDDVFISDIGEDTISVSVFVGSEKLVIPNSAVSDAASYKEITIGTEDDTDIFAWIDTNGTETLKNVDNIHFQVTPSDFYNPALDEDEWNWLVMGNTYEDPLFGFSLAFESMMPSIESRTVTELNKAGDAYNIIFTNNDGDEYDFEIIEATSATVLAFGDGGNFQGVAVANGNTDLEEDHIFILESTDAKPGEKTTYVFEVRDINTDDNEVTLKELGSGTSKVYDLLTDEIEDTGVKIDDIATGTPDTFSLDADTVTRFIAEDGLTVTWDLNQTADDFFDVIFTEDTEDADESGANSTLTARIAGHATDDIVMGSAAWAVGINNDFAADDSGDNRYGVSDYGTWFEQDTEDDNYLKVYYSGEETDFAVFINGPDAVVVSSGSASGDAYVLNEMVVGQIAIYDSEALSMIGKTPLIVVGGPCANTAAMQLMGNPEVCYEGFTEGRAKIKFWDSQSALLVAGYSGADTTGAAQVIAGYQDYTLSGDEVEVVTTDLKNLVVNVVN